MKKLDTLKAILISLLVTLALAGPAIAVSTLPSGIDAALEFSGAELRVMSDGSVQAIFQVSVNKAVNCTGAAFTLDYNPDYFTPSDMATNAPLDMATVNTDDFFAYDPDLYRANESPFSQRLPVSGAYYSQVIQSSHTIMMNLWLDRDYLWSYGADGKVLPLLDYGLDDFVPFVFNKQDTETATNQTPDNVALGTLSFRVNPERLAEIAHYFPNSAVGLNPTDPTRPASYPAGTPTETYLIRISPNTDDGWSVGHAEGDPGHMTEHFYNAESSNAQVRYFLGVDNNVIVSIRPAEEEFSINAYEAFSYGDIGDVRIALGKYSPMATITYLDGRERNMVIPWGAAGSEYTVNGVLTPNTANYPNYDPSASPVPPISYDPTHGEYIVTQHVLNFPVPIRVRMHVTPITLLRMEVERQTKTYRLDDVVSTIKTAGDLELPEEARLVTDLVPGGVSMVMNIPGWMPEKGTWPRLDPSNANATTLMNTLKEDSFPDDSTYTLDSDVVPFDPGVEPYWPDDNDNMDIPGKPEKFLWQYKVPDSSPEGYHYIWLGKYTFHMADSYGTATSQPNRKPEFTKSEIQSKFPWLTVPNDTYAVPDVLRQIVTSQNYKETVEYTASWVSTVTDVTNDQPTLTLSLRRTNNVAMADGSIFRVWLPDGEELGTGLVAAVWPEVSAREIVEDWFPVFSEEVDDGTGTGGTVTVTWQNGSYAPVAQSDGSFHLVTNTGVPETDDFRQQREMLRRYINLGGWFKVAVCEDPENVGWSDPIPVYVPPRTNLYVEDTVYNFVGDNSELFTWSGVVTHYMSMPHGWYNLVTDSGLPLYNVNGAAKTAAQLLTDAPNLVDERGRPKSTAVRYQGSYGYHTLYDGSTGAQPGKLYTFRVGDSTTQPGDPWLPGIAYPPTTDPSVGSKPITQYGATDFYDGALFSAYGRVYQPGAPQYSATLRRDDNTMRVSSKGISLTCDSPTGIDRVTETVVGETVQNVIQATYDTRTVSYTSRQEYTFTIKNHGSEPIYGLAIDGLTDGFPNEPTGGHFEVIQAPADYLAPGATTTFTLTYVYNLAANATNEFYHDTLYITSSSCCSPLSNPYDPVTNQVQRGKDYLMEFDAVFNVSASRTHAVTLIVNPDDNSMGTANLIVGEQSGSSAINYTPTTRAYALNDRVYVAVYKKDEYSINSVTCVDALGNNIPINVYSGLASTEPDTIVYVFNMPDYDTVVTVNFEEGIFSKLRLSDLLDFSAGAIDPIPDPNDPSIPTAEDLRADADGMLPGRMPNAGDRIMDYIPLKRTGHDYVIDSDVYTVWRKSFTDQEKTDAGTWALNIGGNPEADMYLMTAGRAITRSDGGNQFINTENQYLVVIPYEADFSQVEVTLRALATRNNYLGTNQNQDIQPSVYMYWFDKDIRTTWNTTIDKNHPVLGVSVGHTGNVGDTAGPTSHTSAIFKSPDPGTSNYLRITIELGTDRRSYYLEIHRAPKEPIATLHYGNSPYGMIMNASNFYKDNDPVETNRLRTSAKNAFLKGFTFRGLDVGYLPKVLQDDPDTVGPVIYWREAWVKNTQIFEPESNTGYELITTYEKDAQGNDVPVYSYEPIVWVYDEAENLDLNDYAFFAILGEDMLEPGVKEALDSSGRKVELTGIKARVVDMVDRSRGVTLLDMTRPDQLGRFSGVAAVGQDIIDLGVAGSYLTGLTEPVPATPPTVDGTMWPASSSVSTVNVNDENGLFPNDPGWIPTTAEVTTYTQIEHIRPGQYVLEYVYKDYDGDDELVVHRPMVILSKTGDVNVDGLRNSTRSVVAAQRTVTDEYVLENRVADPLGFMAGKLIITRDPLTQKITSVTETVYPRSNIFKFRVCDVNNDRNVNNIDGNQIDKNTLSTAMDLFLRFYNPVNYGHP